MTERRSIERFEIDLPVQLECNGKVQKDIATADISSKGVFLRTHTPFSLGVRVGLSVFVPVGKDGIKGESMIRTSGKVIRVQQSGMAVLFDHECKISSLSHIGH